MKLREYQQGAHNAAGAALKEEGNPLIVAPTGSGKSVLIASLIRELRGQRVLMLSHVKEILEQNARKIITLCPGVPIGIYSASLGSKRFAQITIAQIQSLHRKIDSLPVELLPDVVIVDEAHLVPRKSSGMYRKTFECIQKKKPSVKFIGYTATPYRLDSGLLHDGDGALFTHIAYSIDVARLVREGFLSPLVSKASKKRVDMSGVRTAAGDYVKSEAAILFDKEAITKAAVDEITTLGVERKSWLVFCSSIKHGENVTREIKSRGISCELVTGNTLPMVRDKLLGDFSAGKIRCLINVDVLTTGFDAPNIDLIALLRGTKSTGLFVQMLGRGMRPAPNKVSCLVLDYAGNLERHGPIDAIEIKSKSNKGEGVHTAPVKICPQCDSALHAALKECPDCGYIFPEAEATHAVSASAARVMASLEPPECFEITNTVYLKHERGGKTPSMRVKYEIGIDSVSEWVCLEHHGYAGIKAGKWWLDHGGMEPTPTSVAAALTRTNELKKVKSIWVAKEGKYDRVLSCKFWEEEEQEETLLLMDEMGI